MDSATKSTCIKEFAKLNGQSVCDVLNVTVAKMPLSISTSSNNESSINHKKTNTTDDTIINLVSPTPPETETIMIVDDAEPEEGEIINTDSEFEYEAISSDEEFTLRQQIEALEAKNRELEKIASISSRTIDYNFTDGYHRPQTYTNYKTPLVSNRITKISPPSKTLSLSHVENISSDEAQLNDSENEFSGAFDISKSHSRSHRTSSKKDKRQNRRKPRTIDTEKERCLAHDKRRCIDPDCISLEISRKKRVRHKYDDRKTIRAKYSSDSEDELLRNREELKMALNKIEPTNRTVNSSSLLQKLSAIQNHPHNDDVKQKLTNKQRKRKNSQSPDHELNRRRRTNETIETTNSKRSKIERDKIVKSKLTTSVEILAANNHNENDAQEEDDETISLEEQELRLIALKSAVLKKHEARKKKQLAQSIEQVIRPYSPTDSVVLVADDTGERSNDCIDSDNNNMDISPISSPISNQYQPMDMDLASSNENSNSPVYSYEKPQTFPPFEQFIDWGAVHIPVPINASYVEIDPTTVTLNHQQPFTLQPPYSLVYDAMQKEITSDVEANTFGGLSTITTNLKENDMNEDELRAQLIEQMRSTNNTSLTNTTELNQLRSIDDKLIVPNEMLNNVDDSLEEDCLRSLLLSSKGKKSNILKETNNESPRQNANATIKSKQTLSLPQSIGDNAANCDDMPKPTLILREALKRLKNNQQHKIANNQKPVNETKLHVNINESDAKQCVSFQNCDSNEIQKTVVNNRIDNNENELCNVQQSFTKTIVASPNDSDEMVIDDSTSNDSVKKEPTIHKQTIMIDKNVSVLDSKSSVEEKLDVNLLKQENKETSNMPIESKILIKSVPKKTTKVTTKQPAEQPIVVTKLKKNVDVPVIVAVRPNSATPPLESKVNHVTMATTAPTINKLESIRKLTASPVVAWTPKPVKKLIISLNGDSSSDTDDLEPTTAKKMDTDTPSTEPNTFQLRLDQFLQKVRANTTVPNTIKQQVGSKSILSSSTTTKKIVTKATTVQQGANNSAPKIQVSSKTESSKAVAHLPMSSQLEYHRLMNRMKILEKQKEERKSRVKQQEQIVPILSTVKPDPNVPNVTVVVKNENRIIQIGKKLDDGGDRDKVLTESSQLLKPLNVNKIATKPPSSTSNTSLAKRVLVKNAMDSLTTTKPETSQLSSKLNVKAPAMKLNQILPSVQSNAKQTENTNAEPVITCEVSTTDTKKATTAALAAFAKKTPKVRASLLANWVKKYRNHGEQYLNDLAKLHQLTSRTNVETKKQQKLELVLVDLKRQTQIVEAQLAQQKTVMQNLYPAMAAAEETVCSDRNLLHKLERCCNRLGNIVKGSDYKIQCDNVTAIKEKIRLINVEKNRLKLIKLKLPSTVPSTSKSVITPAPPLEKKDHLKNVNKAQSIPETTMKCSAEVKTEAMDCIKDAKSKLCKQIDDKDKPLPKNDTPETVTKSNISDTSETNFDSEPNKSENSEKCLNNSEIEKNETKPNVIVVNDAMNVDADLPGKTENEHNQVNEIEPNLTNDLMKITENASAEQNDVKQHSPDNLTGSATTLNNLIIESETQCGKYDSPLVHLQNCIDTKPNLSTVDRNAIVCPYDLMGRCEDKQCEYKHLST